MHIYRAARSRNILISSMLGGILLLLSVLGGSSPAAHAQEQGTPPPRTVSSVTVLGQDPPPSEYYSVNTLLLPDGTIVQRHNIHGPSVPPAGYEAERQPVELSAASSIILPNVPAYSSNLGCSGVSGGINAAFGDRGKLPNLYRGPTNNGVLPLDDSAWGDFTDVCGATYRRNPIISSQNGLDGRTTRGTIDDYWVSNESPILDPYTGSQIGCAVPAPGERGGEIGSSQAAGWTQHTWGDAIGDYMYTSQSAYGNIDGSTAFYTYQGSGRPYTCNTAEIENLPDGTRGMRHFYEARGYAVPECYNQPTDNIASGGFSFANLKTEIDAGWPVILGLEGHSVVGIGYDTAANLVYIHDGWDSGTHTMTWITDNDPNTHPSYAGRRLLMANIIHPIPPAHAGDVTISGYVGVPNATVSYTGGSTKASMSGYYSFSVAPGWSGSVTPFKPGYTFDPPSRNYPNVPDYQTQQNYAATLIANSNLIQDPSFESGTPNPIWDEYSTNFGSPLCEKGSPYCQGVTPRTGMFWGWFGGTDASETARLSQTVTIPEGSAASLDFYLMIGQADAGSSTDDAFTVKVDATTVFSANATEINSYAAYMPVNVDLSAYADGTDHLITFQSVTSGQVVSFHLDDVSLAVMPLSPPGSQTLSVSKSGTGSGTVTSNPAGINCGLDCSEVYSYNTVVTLTASPATGSTLTSWTGGGCSGTGTCIVVMTKARNVTATFTQGQSQTFADVPPTHLYYQDIQILYANGLTGGCSTSPLKYCPDQTMNRGAAAVFILRGNFGNSFVPNPATHILKDDWTKGTWAEPWAEAMYYKGLSAGCSSSPLKYCPWDQIPREQAVIFALRLKYGNSYTPPPATGTLFADMTNKSYYATSWAEQAYKDGLIPNCGTSGGKPKLCPKMLVSRGLGAYMIVRAKSLSVP